MDDSLKSVVSEAIDAASDTLHQLSKYIWENPELGLEEYKAHDYISKVLQDQGFTVTPHYLLQTAFRAEYGDDSGPCVGLMCEYDALPEIGHACGHNLIAEAAVAAAIGIKAGLQAAEKMDKKLGKVVVLGTPAEENYGGKIMLLEKGGLAGMDVSMMVHPKPTEHPSPESLCVNRCNVTYVGKASHAAAYPWEGINALDAVVLAYNNISVLRQQLKPSWRVHGVITNGGAKPNVIPESAALRYYYRAPSRAEMEVLQKKLEPCFRAAALATGCTVEIEWEKNPYYNLLNNKPLSDLYANNLRATGFSEPFSVSGMMGSTDMGNVCFQVPSIHPVYKIGSMANHTREFATISGEESSQAPTLQRGKAMAMSAIDVYTKPDCLDGIKKSFQEDIKKASE